MIDQKMIELIFSSLIHSYEQNMTDLINCAQYKVTVFTFNSSPIASYTEINEGNHHPV